MNTKIILLLVLLLVDKSNVFSQDNLSLREALRYKTWYVIKIITGPSLYSDLRSTELCCTDDKPYFFSLNASDRKLKRDYSSFNSSLPREIIIGNDHLYYLRAKIDSTFERVDFKINSYSEDYLDFTDNDNKRYLLISDYMHSL